MKKDSQIAAGYLSEYSDTVEALPLELQRNYTLIRQLDENAEEIMSQVAKESNYISTNAEKLSLEEKRSKLEHIGQLLNEALKKGEEKFALAKSTYDTVDRHCTRLDNDLQKIEEEQLIGPGRTPTSAVAKRQRGKNGADRDISDTDAPDKDDVSLPLKKSGTSRGRKRLKKDNANNDLMENTNKEDIYLSTEDAIQHAKAAVMLSDLPIDPNEPLYCYCHQVSFGEMVACDNSECEIEWFHLECAGLKTPPKGKWYCKNCTVDFKKKKKI